MINSPPRIWFDCSHTMCNGHRSGVQRTVRKLLDACMADKQLYAGCEAVIAEGDNFYIADTTVSYRIGTIRQDALGRMPKTYQIAARWLCAKTGSSKLRKWLVPDPGHLGIAKPYAMLRKKYLELQAYLRPSRRRMLAQPAAGDLLLLSDSYWERPRVWSALRKAREQGVRIATVIYDLIPLRHPGFVPEEAVETFRNYLDRMIEQSDCLICISKTVQQDLQDYINEHHPEKANKVRTDVFQLGCEMQPRTGNALHPMTKLFGSDNPPYLMVATFDPHKNHNCVISAFEELWRTNPQAQICFVGARGSHSKAILERIESHPRFEKQLHKFHNVDDASLAHCYRHAAGVICPSFVEGFGLPIVESLHYERRTLASNTPIHREIGRSNCEYFSPDQPSELAELLRSTDRIELNQTQHTLTSWQQSWRQLLAAAMDNHPQQHVVVKAA